jgi:hypothetical protein
MNTFENLLIFLFWILLPLLLLFRFRKSKPWHAFLILFLALIYIVISGNFFLLAGSLLVVFGWIPFLIEKFPQITPNWEGLAIALTLLTFLIYGGHWFLSWLYSHWGGAQASDSKKPWPMRWTLSLVALLVLFFSASIGFIGATHQTAWMIGADTSLLQRSWRGGAYHSDAKSNLHNMYLACKAYWADNGSENSCSRQFYNSTSYGYIQSANVLVEGGGIEKDFHAVAAHTEGDRWFWINPQGRISKVHLSEPKTR